MLVESTVDRHRRTAAWNVRFEAVHVRLESWASRLDRHHLWIVLCLGVIYAGYIQIPARRILWHDELFTFYIAKSRSIHEFIEAVSRLDLNPPLAYVFTRISRELFGDSPFATRIPFMLAFFLASVGFMYFLARRTGMLWGAAAVLLIWYSPYFYYAAEARPYSILLGFFSLTLLSWDTAIRDRDGRRTLPLIGVSIGGTGMMLTHVFGLFSIMPFCLAEIVRWYRTRKSDWALWACLVLPLTAAVTYVPLIQRFEAEVFPYQFQGSFHKIAAFYTKKVISGLCPGILAALTTALVLTPQSMRRENRGPLFRLEHLAFCIGILLPPVLINLLLMRTHGAFWERYCITTAVSIYVVIALFIAYRANYLRVAALGAAVVVLLLTVVDGIIVPYVQERGWRALMIHQPISSIEPQIPFVVASGLTFMALDHNEGDDLLKRTYYLTDRQAAIKYVHSTLFEGIAVEKNFFPIRGKVLPYREFIKEHKHFTVLGNMYYEEDWLLMKLRDDGAQLKYLGEYNTPYKDRSMFDVVVSPR